MEGSGVMGLWKWGGKRGLSLIAIMLITAGSFSAQAEVIQINNINDASQLVGVIVPAKRELKKVKGEGGASEYDPVKRMKVISKAGGIPSFLEVSGGSLGKEFYVRTGFLGATPVFVVSRIFPNFSQQIIGIHHLPKDQMEVQLEGGADGYVIFRDKGYLFSEVCSYKNSEKSRAYVFGLVNPEQDKRNCNHSSERVVKAWQFDAGDAKIIEVETNGLQCEIITMQDCE